MRLLLLQPQFVQSQADFTVWISAKQNGASDDNTKICIVIGAICGAASVFYGSVFATAYISGLSNGFIDYISKWDNTSLSISDRAVSFSVAYLEGVTFGIISSPITAAFGKCIEPVKNAISSATGISKAVLSGAYLCFTFDESMFWGLSVFGISQISPNNTSEDKISVMKERASAQIKGIRRIYA